MIFKSTQDSPNELDRRRTEQKVTNANRTEVEQPEDMRLTLRLHTPRRLLRGRRHLCRFGRGTAEAAAIYAASVAAPPPPAVLPARIDRAGPATLEDHELLGLVGIDIDIATLAAAGGCASSSTTPTTRSRPSSCPPRTAPGSMLCTSSATGGWRPGCAGTVRNVSFF